MPHKPPTKHKPGKGKKSDAPLKGLKSAGPAGPHGVSSSAPPYKQPPPVDPSKILKDAIKAKEVEALAQQAASYP